MGEEFQTVWDVIEQAIGLASPREMACLLMGIDTSTEGILDAQEKIDLNELELYVQRSLDGGMLKNHGGPHEPRVRVADAYALALDTGLPISEAVRNRAKRLRVQQEQLHIAMRHEERHQQRCRAIAEVLWEQNPKLTIADMIKSTPITVVGCERTPYKPATLRRWINYLCPDRSPGRRPRPSKTRSK